MMLQHIVGHMQATIFCEDYGPVALHCIDQRTAAHRALGRPCILLHRFSIALLRPSSTTYVLLLTKAVLQLHG